MLTNHKQLFEVFDPQVVSTWRQGLSDEEIEDLLFAFFFHTRNSRSRKQYYTTDLAIIRKIATSTDDKILLIFNGLVEMGLAKKGRFANEGLLDVRLGDLLRLYPQDF